MNYKEISDKWKVFLTENAFKEDKLVKKPKKKKQGKKELIVSEEDPVQEWEEFDEDKDNLEEMSGMSGGAVAGFAAPLGSKPVKRKLEEEDFDDK